ncbi:hypothetical protein HK099_001634 [Clydaea vesicula]|uniref:Uncharacterized protein n=1 Tax=Clydaea vesicula TaxID=447962 RepID=A0AAD5XWW6_9FUNG|nr:hypothetical protein HK099_001634 [Clydaea vesicula]KAJ3385195.1 hypothetical protein HDU92_003171 [Lobulomyces angularis]
MTKASSNDNSSICSSDTVVVSGQVYFYPREVIHGSLRRSIFQKVNKCKAEVKFNKFISTFVDSIIENEVNFTIKRINDVQAFFSSYNYLTSSDASNSLKVEQ